ncbi:MAG: NAD(P)-binding domain-containing protein [Alphaproteobacteria bacterium]|nr:NAD(P)-binding domain-containing protein [Alphaproteobacteria bacterium]
MKNSVIGVGRWGSFIAWYLGSLGKDVLLYGRENSQSFQNLKKNRKNEYVVLQEQVSLSSSLEEALSSDFIFISIPVQKFRSFCHEIRGKKVQGKIILCMKGLEITTGKRLSEIAKEEIGLDCAVLVGPGHAQSLVRGVPTCMLVDSEDEVLKERVVQGFSSDLIRLYRGHDLIGAEIGAATKNIIGLGAGMLDGFGYSEFKGALMARSAYEISQFIEALGGKGQSAYGLAHLGDYEATLFSKYSHNRLYGENFILGKTPSKRAEGVETLRAVYKIAQDKNLDLPICESLYQVLFEDKDPKEILKKLFSRPLKGEF